MLTLAQYLQNKQLAPSEFAARLADRLAKPVSQQNVYRWTRPTDHHDFSIPSPRAVVAIEAETAGKVKAASWYQHLRARPRSIGRRRSAA